SSSCSRAGSCRSSHAPTRRRTRSCTPRPDWWRTPPHEAPLVGAVVRTCGPRPRVRRRCQPGAPFGRRSDEAPLVGAVVRTWRLCRRVLLRCQPGTCRRNTGMTTVAEEQKVIEARASSHALAELLFRFRELGILLALALVVVAATIDNPNFLSATNVQQILSAASIIALLAIGETIVIITRNVDL